jgi:hypothetical protein
MLLEIGVVAVVMTLLFGGWVMVHWAREQWERDVSKRRREEVLEAMTRAGEQALDPDPAVSLDGLRTLGALHDDKILDPEDDDFVEEIAGVVISTRFDADDEGPLFLGMADGVDERLSSRIVLPHQLLAAMLMVDVATARGREPTALASRIVNASPVDPSLPADAEPEPEPLKRSA